MDSLPTVFKQKTDGPALEGRRGLNHRGQTLIS
jgi:hypothetical protein